jgi:hypothetical protein
MHVKTGNASVTATIITRFQESTRDSPHKTDRDGGMSTDSMRLAGHIVGIRESGIQSIHLDDSKQSDAGGLLWPLHSRKVSGEANGFNIKNKGFCWKGNRSASNLVLVDFEKE